MEMIFVYISWGILLIIGVSTAIHLKGYYKSKRRLTSTKDNSPYSYGPK